MLNIKIINSLQFSYFSTSQFAQIMLLLTRVPLGEVENSTGSVVRVSDFVNILFVDKNIIVSEKSSK